METQTYNGVTYQRSGPGQPWQRVGASGGRVIPKSTTTQQKEGADADRAQAEAEKARVEAGIAAPQANADLVVTDLQADKLAAEIAKIQSDATKAEMTAAVRKDAIAGYQSADKLERLANDLEARFNTGVGKTSGVAGVIDFIPSGENSAFNSTANQARATIKQALGFTGGEGNTASESQINYGPYIPQTGDFDENITAKIQALRDLASDARRKSVATLGGVPDANGSITPAQVDERGRVVLPSASQGRRDPGIGANGVQDAGTGGLSPVPEFRGMAGDVKSLIQQGASADEVIGYIAKRHRDAGFAPPNDERKQFIRDVVAGHEKRPDVPVSSLGSSWQSLEMQEAPDEGGTILGGMAAWQDPLFGSSPGAAAISAGNAVTAGNLANLAGDNAGGVMNAMREDNPWSSFAGDVVGSGIAMAGINRLAALAPGGGALTGMSGLGGDVLYGATRGYSEGDGDWRYGLLGGVAAAAGNRAGAGLSGGDRIARPVEMALDTAPGQRIARLLGTEVPPRPSAAQRIIARDVGDNGDAIARMLAEGQALDIPVTLADTTPQLRARAGSAFRNAGQDARDTVTQFQQGRQLGQADRTLGQIEQSFGPVSNPNRVAEALTQQARTQAAPLYEAAYASPGRMTPELEAILSTPAGQQALRNAQQIAANERRDPLALGFNDIDAEGNVALTRTPSMETLDLVKRGLDQVIEGRRDPVTGRLPTSDPSLSSVVGLRADLVRELDNLNPDYAAARSAYAGPAQAREAMETGRGFMRLSPRDIEDQIGRMGPNQQDMYRLGARTALSDRVEQARLSTNPLNAIYGSPVAQQRIASVFPDGADRFGRAYGLESEMARTGQELLGGSPTASRIAADQQLSDQIGEQLVNGAVDTAITGAPIRTGVSLLGKGLANTGVGRMKEGVANEIAQMLALQSEPDAVARLLAETAARRRYIDDLRSVGSRSGSALLTPFAFAGSGNE